MRDWADEHAARWSQELAWLDPVQEAIFVRLLALEPAHVPHTRS
jgi:hypothetical protein